MYLPILRHSKHSFFKCPRRSQSDHCPWVCTLIHFLEVSLFSVVVVLHGRKAWRTWTSICTPFYCLRIFLLIPMESGKIYKITWILVFIIILKATCLVDLPLSPNNPWNFKENIIDYGNRQERLSLLIRLMSYLICFSYFMIGLFRGNNKLYQN